MATMATTYASVAMSSPLAISKGNFSCSRKPAVQRLSPSLLSPRNGFSKRRGHVTPFASDDEASDTSVPLWRKELPSLDDGPAGESWLRNASMEADIARLQKKRELEKRAEQLHAHQEREGEEPKAPQAGGSGGGSVKAVVEKLLVADFFFILLILAWLVAGLVERSALESTALLDAWLPLWAPVFQPALGVFMAGAMASAIAGALAKKESS